MNENITKMSNPAPNKHAEESTFRAYTPSDATIYHAARPVYSTKLYALVLRHHVSTGGQLRDLVDVGCGPGPAVRALAPHFDASATGLDPSPGMVETARAVLAGLRRASGNSEEEPRTKNGGEIQFRVSPAETLEGVADASVDLIVAATAAHWFDMPRFWRAAGRVVRPGGSVVMWAGNWGGGSGNFAVEADATPNAERIGREVRRIWEEELDGFVVEGNRLVGDLYRGLGMPWDGSGDDEGTARLWDRERLTRLEWGTESEGALDRDDFLEGGVPMVGLDQMEKVLGTGSVVTRWRAANPEKVGTEEDVLRRTRRAIERALRDAGVEEGEEKIKAAGRGVMLVVKRSAVTI